MVFAHVHQCASSARGVRPRVGVALSWGYAQAGQRGGRWQLRSAAVSSAAGQPPLQAMQGRISSWAQLCDQPVPLNRNSYRGGSLERWHWQLR